MGVGWGGGYRGAGTMDDVQAATVGLNGFGIGLRWGNEWRYNDLRPPCGLHTTKDPKVRSGVRSNREPYSYLPSLIRALIAAVERPPTPVFKLFASKHDARFLAAGRSSLLGWTS